ncbi:MAG: cytochrome-c peroxidase [Zetaproteobacteria bacterium]|nr:cytochrome-c peroxidase [Zetaproteobacteria bacterium]
MILPSWSWAEKNFSSKHMNEPIQPLEAPVVDKHKVALGDKLFHDPRLSADDSISCASCHSLDLGGTDNQPRSLGIKGQLGAVNAPTVFNSGFNLAQFWNGRASTLEEQAAGPIHNPVEMGSNFKQVIEKLSADREYVQQFQAIYPDQGITSETLVDAIATFERSLVTIDSPFDRYLRGEEHAINAREKRGYELFQDYGCVACHQGKNVGGNMYQKFGIMDDYFAKKTLTDADNGRFSVTGFEEDRFVFKVPGLRLAVLTAPYFHNGSTETLEEAINTMAHYQLGRTIPKEDVEYIIDFLHSLVGQYKGKTL